jgi:hypothetical protein
MKIAVKYTRQPDAARSNKGIYMKIRRFELGLELLAALIVLIGVSSAANSAFSSTLGESLKFGVTTSQLR